MGHLVAPVVSMGNENRSGPLVGRRVLDLALGPAAYCGKLLADLGADVVKVEPPAGDPYRRELPPAGDGASFSYRYHNTSKRLVNIDLHTSVGQRQLLDLAAAADLVVEAFDPGFLVERGLAAEVLTQRNPHLVVASISGFGHSGPHSSFKSCDLVASAMGGVMHVTGEAEDPPVKMRGSHATVMAATTAAASSLMALWHAERTGCGQHIDISMQEVVASVSHITGAGKWLDDGIVPRRMGSGLFASIPSGAYPCSDGLVYLMVNRPAHWRELARWIHEVTGESAVLEDLFEGPSANRFQHRQLIDHFVTQLTTRFTVAEMYEEGQRRHLAFAPVNKVADVVDDAHLASRGFFVEVEDSNGSRLRYPAPPYRFLRKSARIRNAAPVDGGSADGIKWRERPSLRGGEVGEESGGSGGALAGLRVVELTAGMAGPWIGRMMAYHGADVIKVESSQRPDVTRQYISPRDPEAGVQSQLSPWLTDWNAGKRFVGVDLTKSDGAELVRQLVRHADVVIDNYANGVAAKLGLSYAALSEVRPDLVMLSSSGFGDSGPYKDYISWGPNIEAVSGLSALTGFPWRDCTMTQFAYPDSLSALHGLVAVMAALSHRQRSGRGEFISLSQTEASIAVVGELMMQALNHGAEPVKLGNGSESAAPHGCYPCVGDDRWCAIAVFTDSEWKRLSGLIGKPELAERLATTEDRLANRDEIDRFVSDWTRSRDAFHVMAELQAAGIAAGVVQTVADKYEGDPHLHSRGYFETIGHEVLGEVVADGIPTGHSLTPGHTGRAGRAIGADNAAVFQGVVGLSSEEYQSLIAADVIEDSG